MKSNRNIGMIWSRFLDYFMASWVWRFISARPFSSSILSRMAAGVLFSLERIRFTEPTEQGVKASSLTHALEKGSGFRRRVVGRLVQSPFEDWRLIRLARSYGVAGRDAYKFSARRSRSVNPDAASAMPAVAAGSTRSNATHEGSY